MPTTVPPSVRERRDRWLDELRSDHYNQGHGSLFKATKRGNIETPDRKCFLCCIAVALMDESTRYDLVRDYYADTFMFGEFEDLEIDDTAYSAFRSDYLITEKTQRYLMAMNDGTPLTKMFRTELWEHSIYDENIRVTKRQRSFKFIARFLEIMWALEVMEDENV